MTHRVLPLTFVLLSTLGVACEGDPVVAEGIFADMGQPLPRATEEQRETFARGQAVALGRFTPETGLGPHFNVSFCAACHERPVAGGSSARYRDFLLVRQELSDGSAVNLGVNGVLPHFDMAQGRFPTPPDANAFATRNAIPFFGVGLIAAIPEEEILANADPDDRDGDGISGRPNFDRGFVGRFGRKSQTASIEGFIRGPLFNHLGVTSNPLSQEFKARLPVPSNSAGVSRLRSPLVREMGDDAIGGRIDAQAAAPEEPNMDDDDAPDPELSEQGLFDLVSWSMLLAAPQPDEPTVGSEAGKALFEQANCSGCHIPALRGPDGLIPAYSDFLLHDMGEELADGFGFLEATGSEFRTQPLWGVAATPPYLHDGRADTLDQAIRAHGGEANAARDAYASMSDMDRGLVIEFLVSLGGRDQASEGLVPPDAPILGVGEIGGPSHALDEAESARFLEGRAVFDRDVFVGEGLGPSFNGDSCRACHFDPVIGGAGPADVDVTRHGILDASGDFRVPDQGTMAHRHSIEAHRPPFDPDANVIERRQTPTLFGMGLIDRIPEAFILALADPADEDGDGVSGIAHVLPDGRVGRFGWKAGVPSTAEFVRDGMFNEMGVTLPPQDTLTFGGSEDDDAVADPEITVSDLEALEFFMNALAPPPRTHGDRGAENAGELLFGDIGCVNCHATFTLEDGTAVNVYSDFLLHDVQEDTFTGVTDGEADTRHLRTAPLWGSSQTAPYMHDGRAYTFEEAIADHMGEARGAREAYQALDAEARGKLLAFLRSL